MILNIGFIISIILLVIATIFAIFVIRARLEDKYEDNIFFKNIIKMEYKDYKEYIKKLKPSNIEDDFTGEIYTLAEINSKKYKNYSRSLCFIISGILVLIASYLTSIIVSMIY